MQLWVAPCALPVKWYIDWTAYAMFVLCSFAVWWKSTLISWRKDAGCVGKRNVQNCVKTVSQNGIFHWVLCHLLGHQKLMSTRKKCVRIVDDLIIRILVNWITWRERVELKNAIKCTKVFKLEGTLYRLLLPEAFSRKATTEKGKAEEKCSLRMATTTDTIEVHQWIFHWQLEK